MEDIRRKYNPLVDLSKFTSNKQILSGVVVLNYNLICCQTLFFKYCENCCVYNITHVIIIFKRVRLLFIYLFIYGGRLLKHKLFDSGRLPSLQRKTKQMGTFIKKSKIFFSNFTSAPPIHRCLEVEGKEVGDAILRIYF